MSGFRRNPGRMVAPRKGAVPRVPARLEALLREASAARLKGDREAAITGFSAAADFVVRSPGGAPAGLFYDLAALLYQANRLGEAEKRLRQGLRLAPKNFGMTNLLGVVLKNQRRFDEALATLIVAEQLEPENLSAAINLGNLHMAQRDGAAAAAAFERCMRAAPQEAEHHRLLGGAYRLLGRSEEALAAFAKARALKPTDHRIVIDAVGLLDDLARPQDAAGLLDEALAEQPTSRPLCETKLVLLRRAALAKEAITFAHSLVERFPGQAWVHMQLARCVMNTDRAAANGYLREAVRLEPNNPDALAELAESLDRTRGPEEAANIEEAYAFALRRLALGGNMLPHARGITSILNRACDFEAAAAVGSFETLTRHWADTGFISALHYQMAQVADVAQRRLLLEAHRSWGATIDAQAGRAPIARPAVRGSRAKIRLGLMSSDLRNHPVAYFALPLIEGYDRERFELFCYSWNSDSADWVQNRVAALSDGFRLAPVISDRDAARLIAADGLDMLIELGGTTYMNKLNVMAYKPAPVQASWLGYPHSAGPASIDYILVDPYINPADPTLLIEKPLLLDRSWVVLGTLGFHDRLAIEPGTPEQRAGHLTFGTMNNPYKFTHRVIETWARIVAAAPDAHFLFVRPEANGAAFQTNIRAIFAAAGVAGDRVEFTAVRGAHMPHYNRIDIALDSFPQTGGTTTCEALWMGVPVVSLVGPCFFERLSNSNLHNAGLGDLCVPTLEAYHATALALAADPARRAALRQELRSTIRASALGKPELFVADFEAAVQRAVAGHG